MFQIPQEARKKIRVLSLFDGISTAYFILSHVLNLEMEVYFSSELDSDALAVQRERYFGKIVQLGPVEQLTEDLLNSLGRIDLVVGGSPCNQLARVNWRKKGFTGKTCSGINIVNSISLASQCSTTFFFFFLFYSSQMRMSHQILLETVMKNHFLKL